MAENVYLLEIEEGHRVDGDGWTQDAYIYLAYVADDEIRKYSAGLAYIDKFGSAGAGDGQFNNAHDVCSDKTYLYTIETINDRVQKFLSSDFSFDSKLGSGGAGDGEFANAQGLCTDGTYLYVADTGNNRIQKLNCSDLAYVAKIGSVGSGDNEFSNPIGICTDGTYVYIADVNNNRIKKHNCSDLAYVAKVGSSGSGNDQFTSPRGICTDGTYVYVIDNNDRINKRNCSDLTYVSKRGSNGSGDDEFHNPKDIEVDDSGVYLFISDDGNKRVKKHKCSDLTYVDEVSVASVASYGIGFEGQNSYYISHIEGEPSKVEEDGVALTERGSLALCNDNAGSWYWDSANTRLYVHTTGSDDPAGYIIIAYFWEYLTNAQYVDEDIVFNGNVYLPYLNADDIPDVTNETSGYQEGGTRQSFGSIKIINADGRYDTRLTDYIYEAKKIILKAGIKGGNYASYSTYWIGWTGGIGWSEEAIEIDIEDLRVQHA